MAKTALNQLQQQIEAVRREAFAAGYAAAMQAVRELATKSAPGAEPVRAPAVRGRRTRRGRPAKRTAAERPAQAAAAPRRARRTTRRSTSRRPQRGSNAQMIEEILQSMAPRAVRPAEIRAALQRDKGVSVAFTSIRHALGQLEARQAAEQVGNSRTWRHRGSGGGSAASD
ncbi:MAG TPA: hypothetical protein VF007_03260 [Stellaceae bacterium]